MNIAFTIATSNYLSQAKAVSDSFLKNNSKYKFVIILLDKINNRFDTKFFFPAEIVEVERLDIRNFLEMVERYTIFELSNALKPFVAEYLFSINSNVENVLYFDSDIFIYSSFTEIENLFEKHHIIITPHFNSPPPSDGFLLDEKAFLNSGIYNGGFFALKKGKETSSFLSWWKRHMEVECFVDLSNGLFVDQIWLNFVPIYFRHVYIIKNLGYNVAYWNLHERTITIRDQRYIINNSSPLAFYHFSGYNFTVTSGNISKYQTRYTFEQRPDIVELFKNYKETVLKNNYELYKNLSCYYVELKQERQEAEIAKQSNAEGKVFKFKQALKRRLITNLKRLLS